MAYQYILRVSNRDNSTTYDSLTNLIAGWDALSEQEKAQVTIQRTPADEPGSQDHSLLYEIAISNRPELVKLCTRRLFFKLHEWENQPYSTSTVDSQNNLLLKLLKEPLGATESQKDRIQTISYLIRYGEVVIPAFIKIDDFKTGPLHNESTQTLSGSKLNTSQEFFVYAVNSNEPMLVEALVRSYNPPRVMEDRVTNRQQLSHIFDSRFDNDNKKNFIDVACEKNWKDVIHAAYEVCRNKPIIVTENRNINALDSISYKFSLPHMLGYQQKSNKEVRVTKESFWDVISDNATALKAIQMLGAQKISGDVNLHKLITRLGFEEVCNALNLVDPKEKLILYAHSVCQRLSMNNSFYGDEKLKSLRLELNKTEPDPKMLVDILKVKQNPFGIGSPESYQNIPKNLRSYVDVNDESKKSMQLKNLSK